jgi:D-lactate dehydrogenase
MTPALEIQPLLKDGTLGGLGLDVYNEEGALAVALRQHNEPESDELKALLAIRQRDNVILTPHNAFNTTEAVERKAEQSIRQVDHFLKSGDFIWPIPES